MRDWQDHKGKGFPKLHPLTKVLVEFRDGQRTSVSAPVAHWYQNWNWDRRFPGDTDITMYRVVPE